MMETIGRLARSAMVASLCLALASGCGSRRVMVQVPPRLDLVSYGQIGLVLFTVENAKGTLHELATQRFAEEALAAQRGIEVLELGSADTLLKRLGEREFGAAAAKAMGGEGSVPAVFVGHLKISNVKPSGRVLGLRLPTVEATVSVELTVGLLSTKSGGTLWRSSAMASEKVGQLGLSGGEPYFAARDPNKAYGHLVNQLIAAVTQDLWPTWRRS